MGKICSFIINNRIYTVYNVHKIYGKKSYVGQTNYNTRTIYIEKGTFKEQIITLKHELVHVWLYEMGYEYQGKDLCFCVEDVCEIVAYSNDFINDIVKIYIEKSK